MGVNLRDPENHAGRGSFHSRYLRDSDKRPGKTPRLLDCLIAIAATDDPDYFDAPEAAEFAVVDVVTKEKAWFEFPYGCTPEMVTGMIESTFASEAFRVGEKVWLV